MRLQRAAVEITALLQQELSENDLRTIVLNSLDELEKARKSHESANNQDRDQAPQAAYDTWLVKIQTPALQDFQNGEINQKKSIIANLRSCHEIVTRTSALSAILLVNSYLVRFVQSLSKSLIV